MLFKAIQVNSSLRNKKLSYKNKLVCKDFTNFSGTTVPPLTKEQYNKGMSLSEKYKTMSAW